MIVVHVVFLSVGTPNDGTTFNPEKLCFGISSIRFSSEVDILMQWLFLIIKLAGKRKQVTEPTFMKTFRASCVFILEIQIKN